MVEAERVLSNRDKTPILETPSSDIGFHSCDGQGSCRLKDGSRVLKDVLDRRTDFIRADGHHGVDALLRDCKRVLSDFPHSDTIGKQPHLIM